MTIYIVDIEAVDPRYIKLWKEYVLMQLQHSTNEIVKVISGREKPQVTTPEAFLLTGMTTKLTRLFHEFY